MTAASLLLPRAPTLRAAVARLGPALALVLVIAVFALLTDAPARYLRAALTIGQ